MNTANLSPGPLSSHTIPNTSTAWLVARAVCVLLLLGRLRLTDAASELSE